MFDVPVSSLSNNGFPPHRAVYLVIPKQKTIEDCVAVVNRVRTLSNDKDHRVYVLLTDEVAFQEGQR